MAQNASRRGATDLSVPLMIVAFLVMGGFLYWLYTQAQAEKAAQAVVEEEPADTAPNIEGAVTITPDDIQMDASPYEGQLVRLVDVPIASKLGTQGFWMETPNGNPFLVAFSDSLMAQGVTVEMGQTATVVGTIRAMADSIANAWLEAGTINDGELLAAQFATHYLEAQLVVTSGEGEAAPEEGGAGAEGEGGGGAASR